MDLLASAGGPGSRILEVGSGSAGITEFLDHPVTGVDAAFDRTAERATARLAQVEGRADALPVGRRAFDVVLSLEMLEHLPRDVREPALREMVRVLRPGGRLVVTFPAEAAGRGAGPLARRGLSGPDGRPHPWVGEHLPRGCRMPTEVRAALVRAGGAGGRVLVPQSPAGARFKALHGLYTDTPASRR